MHRFEILANSMLIGHTEFERGDAPMGVAFGAFLPIATYASVRQVIVQGEGKALEGIDLVARVAATGQVIECQAGVHITDHSAELGPEGLEVTALGVGYPQYAELFPQHVDAYENQFK
ncbi:hypothetical protein [Roseateles sp. P5_E7]